MWDKEFPTRYERAYLDKFITDKTFFDLIIYIDVGQWMHNLIFLLNSKVIALIEQNI